MKTRIVALSGALGLVLAACGGGDDPADEPTPDVAEPAEGETQDTDGGTGDAAAGALDCSTIEMIVPNAPGGGSDQQVRRLSEPIAEHFGTNVNVVYREGAGGAVGWNSLLDAEPDGCVVSNVVSPNVVIVSMEDEQETFVPDEFAYIAWTEVAPTALIVPNDAPWETLDDFLEEAEQNPGGLTVGGSGQHGEVIGGQIMEATGVDLSYVPMEEGIGGTVPLLLGGHIDAAITHSSHATTNSDTIRALALAGEERVEAISEVPTFHELGYEGVTIMTAQGLMAPPGTPDAITQAWSEAVDVAMEQTGDALTDLGLLPMGLRTDEAVGYVREQMDIFLAP